MSEQDLVNAIIDYIALTGGLAVRINSGMQIIEDPATGQRRAFKGAAKGTSDILACIRGRFYAIECKLSGNKPTAHQQDFLDRAATAGAIAIVAYSIEDVVAVIEALQR